MHCPFRFCFMNCPYFKNQYSNLRCCQPMRILTVTPKELKDKKPYIQSDLKIPVFQGIANKNVQEYINNSIESDVMEFKREMEEAAKEYGDKAAKSKEKFIPYVITSTYKLTYNKNNIISILMIYCEYVKGSDNYIKVSYNFNTSTGKSLMLQDLFIPGSDYKSLINKEIRNELIKNPQKYYPKTSADFKGVADDQPFYLENGHVSVFYGFHEIAPTEEKIPIFKLPLSSFGNVVKPMFR